MSKTWKACSVKKTSKLDSKIENFRAAKVCQKDEKTKYRENINIGKLLV